MKRTFLTVRLSEDEQRRMDELRGKQSRSDFIRELVRKRSGGERQEVDQFVDVLKKIEGVTKIAATLERIEKRLIETKPETGSGEAIDLSKKIVDGIQKLLDAGKGITTIKSGPLASGQFGEVEMRTLLNKEVLTPLRTVIQEGNVTAANVYSILKHFIDKDQGRR